MGSSNSYPTTYPGAHDRALLADLLNRCTSALAARHGAGASVLSILRDQMEAILHEQRVPLVLSWTEHVTHPGTQPGPTVIHLTDSTAGAYALHLDDNLREVLGLMLIEPPDPYEVAAENADCEEPDGPLLEEETAAALFTYLVNESEAWQSGTAHHVSTLTEPEALDYLLARGPLRPHENRALITAVRLLHPERFGPA
ncbi:hypothetical protein ACFY91_34650 [Streptomyces albogriseolus]|uniref:hypothetical protein n=1 Tax=Streptomyces albogriseolus TaxID=1887 RepID=UPI0036EE485D